MSSSPRKPTRGKPTRGKPTRAKRRAFSPSRAGGAIERSGDYELSMALERAHRAATHDRIVIDSLTHPFHTYPARLHPATARELVELVAGGAPGTPTVLDPFCGSGTILVEARAIGARAIGVDLNPLAVRLARAKTWTVTKRERDRLLKSAKRIADATVAEVKAARRSGYRSQPERAPAGIDLEARNVKLSKWFAPHVRRELEFLAALIDEHKERAPDEAEILEIALSSILYKVSKRTSDTDTRKVDRRIARAAAARLFGDRIKLLVSGLEDLGRVRSPLANVILGDARKLEELQIKQGSVDAVITSPPYAGTYDYLDQHGLRLSFLGFDASALEAGEIGSRRAFNAPKGASKTMRKWRRDLAASLKQAGRALRVGGKMIIVVGDSLAGNRVVFAEKLLEEIVPDELEIVARASQTRPKLGGAERTAFADQAKREHIIALARR